MATYVGRRLLQSIVVLWGVSAIVFLLLRLAPSDPVTLAGASLTLVVIATLASWIPARRASRVDPADTLRAE